MHPESAASRGFRIHVFAFADGKTSELSRYDVEKRLGLLRRKKGRKSDIDGEGALDLDLNYIFISRDECYITKRYHGITSPS